MKKIAIGAGILAVILFGGIYFAYSNLDSIVKAAIEKYGTAAAHSDVRLDSVKLSLSTGEGAINGLTVANPSGFTSAKALSFGSISVKLDISSVTGNGPIVITEISIGKPQVRFEGNNSGGSNLQTIANNTSADANSNPKTASGNSGNNGQGRKLIIKDLYIRDGQVDITHPLLQGKSLSAPLPTIHLTNIGKDGGGASPAQVADVILKTITESTAKVAVADLTKSLGSLKNVVGGAGGGVVNTIGGLLGK